MDLYKIGKMLKSGKTIFDLNLRVTYYARVSTEKDAQLHSLKTQVDYYREMIQGNPNWTFVEGYVDEGISGASLGKRESFMKMMDDARDGKFDLIITRDLARFSRNTVDSLQCAQQLLHYGVGVLFVNDVFDTLQADSELRLTIMESIAKEEVRKISERVRRGTEHMVRKGLVLGGSNILGYDKHKGKLVINEKEAEVVRLMFEKYANEGMGLREISTWLAENDYLNKNGNPYAHSTIRNVIRNVKYKGYYCGNKTSKLHYNDEIRHLPREEWIVYKDETGEIVPAIVSEELWDRANAMMEK